MLRQLEHKGVVTRRRSPTDERQVLVGLTEQGTVQLQDVRTRLRELQQRSLSVLSVDERRDLTRHLRRLADIITTQTG